MPTEYTKPPLSLDQQIALLQSRGLIISDVGSAREFLLRHNYYRFTGYGLYYEEFGAGNIRIDKYKSGTSFEHIVEIFEFDEQLKVILQRYLCIFELSFRTWLCYQMSMITGTGDWFLDQSCFDDRKTHSATSMEIFNEFERSKEQYARAFKKKYTLNHLPCWIAFEVITFGKFSKMFENMQVDYRKAVSKRYNIRENILTVWLHSLTVLRNRCAHHQRIWNAQSTHTPKLITKLIPYVTNPNRVASWIVILRFLLSVDGHDGPFDAELQTLLGKHAPFYQQEIGIK